ncbi:gliding motility lipoprotein GldH [Hymenobacter sp. 15J16-1T3B]|uniref:gliding motility lipoprotein GldH n=1 Tax=Hymenobacter sp. 15J16-1T3B TaxID=2886941 RepID=UPI001D124D29|nr:gliding motility lipoprotein GldH [Hymenobacter sp. 15J16-1T3B]MCC3159225.1 gliding motility lipoprotein GldH [Hymenobacter sp. 15J16-1T3B]
MMHNLLTHWRRAALLLLLAPALVACDPNRVYEDNADLKTNGQPYLWSVQDKPAFEFDITDAAQLYNVYFNVRNAMGYGYYNLYMKATLTGPDGKPVGAPMLHQMILMDPKTGEPRGNGTGDIYDHQFLAMPRQRFPQPGKYRVVLEQYMRQDVLPGIMSVGVRVEKVPADGAAK